MTGTDQLNILIGELSHLEKQAETLFRNHDEASLTRQPGPKKWSAVECIEHLTVTSKLYLDYLPQLIDEARSAGKIGQGPFTMDWKGRFLKWYLEPPYRTKARTISAADIHSPQKPDLALEDFLNSQASLRQLYKSAEGLALDMVQVTSPFNTIMKYSLFSCFEVINAHQRRHIWQAAQALQG